MATGPEHYLEAERHLALMTTPLPDGSLPGDDGVRTFAQVALVHATLATAAATALAAAVVGAPGTANARAWRGAIS